VPPQNKPTGAEIATCRRFLSARIAALPELRAILCLGRIAHDSTVRALGLRPQSLTFRHGGVHRVDAPGRKLTLVASYHCSRYNTSTGRLTEAMFADAFALAVDALGD
jgi:uracil-DNA glycosylase family 4